MGVLSAGFRTQVLPNARHSPIVQVSSSRGIFHGVINTATPTGWRSEGLFLLHAPPLSQASSNPLQRLYIRSRWLINNRLAHLKRKSSRLIRELSH